jgi:hypothetical protein
MSKPMPLHLYDKWTKIQKEAIDPVTKKKVMVMTNLEKEYFDPETKKKNYLTSVALKFGIEVGIEVGINADKFAPWTYNSVVKKLTSMNLF